MEERHKDTAFAIALIVGLSAFYIGFGLLLVWASGFLTQEQRWVLVVAMLLVYLVLSHRSVQDRIASFMYFRRQKNRESSDARTD